MSRRSLLPLLSMLLGVALLASAPATGAASLRERSLQPVARGHVLVTLGTPPEWLPQSGRPLTLTLFAGRPAAPARTARHENAYVALQPITRACAGSAAADRERPLHVAYGLFSSEHRLLADGSPFALGGTAPGDYEADLPGVIVRSPGEVRICVWIAASPRRGGLAGVEDVPLLDGLFAASVAVLPTAGPGREYSMSAAAVGRGFTFTTTTTDCGATTTEPPVAAGDGEVAAESLSFGPHPCAGDGSVFSFAGGGGGTLGSLAYSVADATTTPTVIASLGGCDLDAIDGTSPAFAVRYVAAVGCTVGRVLVQPFVAGGVPRGAVVEARIDDGVAVLAPRGTAVELVVNGRPR